MHVLFFAAKRAHYAALRLTRPLLQRFGLTPARFDMLYALFFEVEEWAGPQFTGPYFQFRQSMLTRALGVSRTTVSVMARALEALGLMARTRAKGAREVMVNLTTEGRARVRAVIAELLAPGHIELAIDSILDAAGDEWTTPARLLPIKSDLNRHLRSLRDAAGDTSHLLYPWHEDDCPGPD